jgi:sugar O-acyltransferase (sialic acid O-acetyltransferase NeuD family)
MSKSLFLIGLGGHAKHVIDAFRSTKEWCVSKGFDDAVKPGQKTHAGIECIGKVADIPTVLKKDDALFCCVGSNGHRESIITNLRNAGFNTWPSCVHVSAQLSCDATISDATYIGACATVTGGAHIGFGAYINDGARVTHDVNVGQFAHIGPGSTLLGSVSIGDGTFVGGHAVVLPRISVGRAATVGAGSVVTKNVPENVVVKGNPAK